MKILAEGDYFASSAKDSVQPLIWHWFYKRKREFGLRSWLSRTKCLLNKCVYLQNSRSLIKVRLNSSCLQSQGPLRRLEVKKGETPEAHAAPSLLSKQRRGTLVSNEMKHKDPHLKPSEVSPRPPEAHSMCPLSHTIMNTHTHYTQIHTHTKHRKNIELIITIKTVYCSCNILQ